jgi:acetyltransferase-like isoleucine patch superfamily enzyme
VPVAADVVLGRKVVIPHPELVNLYGGRIGDDTSIGPFVEIQRGVMIGARCKISSHSFICEGVSIEDEVFVGHGVMFVNDREPKAAVDGRRAGDQDWTPVPTRVGRGVAIGSGAVILCGLTLGANAMIGAGAVVTRDIAEGAVVAGSPARLLRWRTP